MPFTAASQQTPINPYLPNTNDHITFRPIDRMSLSFDRSIIGIPAEDDDFTRGLTFFFDPSTGQPSVHSTSEESEDLGETPPYEPSLSSNTTSSHKVLTPPSVLDASAGLHPRIVSSRSGGSSDGGSSDRGPHRQQSPSVSARVSAGTSQAASSPILVQTPTYTEGSPTATPMSPTVDSPIPEPFGPHQDLSDPRAIIDIDRNDVRCLEEIMSLEGQSRPGNSARLSDEMDLGDAETNQSLVPFHSEDLQDSETSDGEVRKKIGISPKGLAIRTSSAPRSRSNPTGLPESTKNGVKKAKSSETTKLMRQLGVCLPCLVNHEKVSI